MKMPLKNHNYPTLFQKIKYTTKKWHKYGKGVDKKAFTQYNSGIDQERTWQKGIILL